MKILKFKIYQCKAEWERGGLNLKKSKSIPVPPCSVGLKSHPIPAPPHLQCGENPRGAKWGGEGQARWCKIVITISNLNFGKPRLDKLQFAQKKLNSE